MENALLSKLQKQFKLTSIDCQEYAKIDQSFMHFVTSCYEIQGVGHLSIMNMRGMGGLMKMKTIILTPNQKNMPLLSYDLISVMGNLTLLLEVYDTTITPANLSKMDEIKQKFSYLPDEPTPPNWYDSIKLSPTLKKKGKTKKVKKDFDSLTEEWIESYLSILSNADVCDKEAKNQKNEEYVTGLLTQGGPSTNQFIKMIGKEKTEEFFYRYIFGTKTES